MAAVLHDGLLDALGREIVDGITPVGSALTLDGICVRFGVSRTVAREAMRMLESMRLITSRRRVGLVVRPREEWDVFDPRLIRWRLDGPQRADQLRSLTELRLAVAPPAAACAAAGPPTAPGPPGLPGAFLPPWATSTGSMTSAVVPPESEGRSWMRMPCRCESRPTTNRPMRRETETSTVGGEASRSLIAARSSGSGRPTSRFSKSCSICASSSSASSKNV